MADEQELDVTASEETVGQQAEAPVEESQEAQVTEAPAEDERERMLAEMRAENERLRQQVAEREGSSERRTETPTTTVVPYEQALNQELVDIQREAAELDRKEVDEGQTVASINKRIALTQRAQRVQAAMTQFALKKQELNIFVSGLPREQQSEFRAYAKQNAHRFADLDAMYDAYDAQRLRKASGKVKVAEKVIAAKDKGVVGTGVREVTAVEAKERAKKMTGKQYDDLYDGYIREGKINEATQLSRDYASGRLVVED